MKNTFKSVLFVLAGIFLAPAASNAQLPLAGHLSFPQEGVHAHLYWEKGPIANDESVLKVEFRSAATHQPSEIASTLAVVPRMQMGSHEHGTSPVTLQKVKDADGKELPGQYQVSRIFFVMGGTWKVNFTLTHADQTVETQTWKVEVPARGSERH